MDSTANSYRHYARIIVKSFNAEIGKIRDWHERGIKPFFKRVMLDINFAIQPNRNMVVVAIKRRN